MGNARVKRRAHLSPAFGHMTHTNAKRSSTYTLGAHHRQAADGGAGSVPAIRGGTPRLPAQAAPDGATGGGLRAPPYRSTAPRVSRVHHRRGEWRGGTGVRAVFLGGGRLQRAARASTGQLPP